MYSTIYCGAAELMISKSWEDLYFGSKVSNKGEQFNTDSIQGRIQRVATVAKATVRFYELNN